MESGKSNIPNRIFASSLRAYMRADLEEIAFEVKVEELLDKVFEGINKQMDYNVSVEDDADIVNSIEITFSNSNKEVKEEIFNRLACLGYGVSEGFETDEEANFNIKLWDEAREANDESMLKLLDESFLNNDSFIVDWEEEELDD